MSETELVVKPNGAIRQVPESSDSIMAVIARAAADPNVDAVKMTQLFELQERFMKNRAEVQFNEAMARLQPRLPSIPKRGKIVVQSSTRSEFATYDDIVAAIKPLLGEEGFSISFDSKTKERDVEYSAKLAHSAGHSETKTITLPADKSGSKNDIQALGSTVSYARRYLVKMHFNIVEGGEDNDGNSYGLIGEKEERQIYDLFAACEMDAESKRKFLVVAEVNSVKDIRQSDYPGLLKLLEKKLHAKRGGK